MVNYSPPCNANANALLKLETPHNGDQIKATTFETFRKSRLTNLNLVSFSLNCQFYKTLKTSLFINVQHLKWSKLI